MSKKTAKKTTDGSSKGKIWTFPKNFLEETISVPKAIDEFNAGNPMHAADLARALGFRQANDWRFTDVLRSANLYALVSGTGASATVRMEKLGQDIVAPSSTAERQAALLQAFRSVPEFQAVEEFYGGKRIPEDEFFLNTLTRNFNVPKDRVQKFAEIFKGNLEFLKSFNVYHRTETVVEEKEPIIEYLPPEDSSTKDIRVRRYLDTCFVMMPFGTWFDRYYQEIYIPAIRDAGFEPVRADELFTTGSVVEQIWEQIVKAKIILADLTDKNPNVFYELGLAHAAIKPVIFVSSKLEDIPFDLRHLRVIIYEPREPNWGEKLKKNISDYIRNAVKDPGKSIPHPFRNLSKETKE